MKRRELLWVPVLLASWQVAGAHTPYGQWVVYRKKHLLIGAHRADPATYELAKKLAAVLAHSLPLRHPLPAIDNGGVCSVD